MCSLLFDIIHIPWLAAVTIRALCVTYVVPISPHAFAIHAVRSPGSCWGASIISSVCVFLGPHCFQYRWYKCYPWVLFPSSANSDALPGTPPAATDNGLATATYISMLVFTALCLSPVTVTLTYTLAPVKWACCCLAYL